jgi:hypothetical protein
MSFRFRRGLRLGPFRLNFTGNGLSSISLGGRGATVNIPVGRPGPARATVGIPGSGLSWSEPLGRPSTRQRRPAAPAPAGPPTTDELVAAIQEAFLGPEGVGQALWHQGTGRGLVAVLLERDETPRAVLEQCQLVLSADRIELHVRRGCGPADTMARARQVGEAARTVLDYAVAIGLAERT